MWVISLCWCPDSKIKKDGLFHLLLSFAVGSALTLQTEELLGAVVLSAVTIYSTPKHRFGGLDRNYWCLPFRKYQRPVDLWEWRYRLCNFELLNTEKPYLPVVVYIAVNCCCGFYAS